MTAKTRPLGPNERCTLLLFYHYCRPALANDRRDALNKFLQESTCELNLGGRMRIAKEGLNCTISGTAAGCRAFAEQLMAWKGPQGPFSDCKQFK